MQINTTRFGRIVIDPFDILHFASGLPGLEHCQHWALLADESNTALGWLQSTSHPDAALAVVSPRRFVPDYRVRIPRSELTPLAMRHLKDAQLLAVVGQHEGRLTLNLKSPIVINVEARTGRQVVASGDLPLRYELVERHLPYKKSA